MNETLITIGGFYHIALTVFHILFWKMFDWKKELKSLSRINRGVMQVMNLRLIYIFLFFSFISLFYTIELLTTTLGSVIIFGICFFWLFRTIEQLIFFNSKNIKSIIMSVVFFIGFSVYLVPVLR